MLKPYHWAIVRIHYGLARQGEAGQGLTEYALILAFVAAICVAALGVLGTGMSGAYQSMATAF